MALVDENSAQVRFPPPLIVLGSLFLGVGVGGLLGWPRIEVAALRPVGIVIAALGLAILGSGLVGFLRAGNDPEPWKKDTALVTSGLYRFSRNPMYLGMVLVQLGIALFAQSIGGLLSVPLAVVLIDHFVIAREERHLEKVFGAEYERLRKRVRRWI
ncbi:methyltransferase family protein [Alteriqipengyuania lutimaris]|uniref:Isoprenylcysteine carboxylmethyltransferase family protein n=1 Tax=Alteriqipengyuania lutimaris TaxID=1538146 RepID=A0A395LL29_9SPHN|nr:isoprenylcysteine carboxylmethyltransferase family protein [Alteriqipengyuania lutimaris]MBB3033271.1 protein-S-isoprenylcysteine O-methyltransferase Ste14 [Alteriqipengyuania lutimaris]RDS77688.1 isoprenylcysteine carboxylmethyltransferase family protein [Alteriqipengyuania lutimaris]